MLSRPEVGEVVLSLYPQLLSCLLVRVGSSVGVRPPRDPPNTGAKRSGQTRPPRSLDVCSCSVSALKALLARGKAQAVLKAMEDEGGWEMIKDPEKHPEGVAVLARAMAQHSAPHLSGIVEQLSPTLTSVYEDQRITVTAFYAEVRTTGWWHVRVE
uniref:Uncharacterized protein n=1 Tax=Callorhinchus milii TaxID=7868 RepID=A0A4W3GPK5_CALMI